MLEFLLTLFPYRPRGANMSKENKFSRRDFVTFLGGTASLALTGTLSSCSSGGDLKNLPFTPISFTDADDLVLARGFEYKVLISFDDPINNLGDRFGSNNDFTAFFPLSRNEAILWVNHEYPDPLFVSGFKKGMIKTKEMVDKERKAVGGSLLHIQKNPKGQWVHNKNSKYNRRIDATQRIPFIASRKIEGRDYAIGTMANCAGGVTPWKTVLTCEENYHDYYGERVFGTRKVDSERAWFGWKKFYDNPPEHYGWVVEVNPLSGEAKKLTGLGRFAHECATCVRTKSGHVAVYSGDDKEGEFLYKFLSKNKDSLHEGELFVADVENGKWISLDIDKQPKLKRKFKDQLDVLIHAREAGRVVGATPLDRPEDIEVHPKTGDVYVALTNNKSVGNYFGSILRIREDGGDHGGGSFKASDFIIGGDQLSCPDNLIFDLQGNLWVTTDMSGSAMNKPPYTRFKNNGLFFIPTSGARAGQAFQVASAPKDAELTGLSFSADYKTLFLSVQHPGEKSKSLESLRSHWPDGGKAVPKSSVVQISGSALNEIVS